MTLRLQWRLRRIDLSSLWFAPADSCTHAVEPTEASRRALTNTASDDVPALETARHRYRETLAFFAAALALCILGYLAAAAPGAWFPGATAQGFSAGRLMLARGAGGLEQGELVVTAVDAAGTALVTIETDFRASDYRVIAWNAIDVAERANASLLWCNDCAPAKLNSVPLAVASGRVLQISPTADPNWIGRIRGLALVIQGPLPSPVRIRGVVAEPMGVIEFAGERAREWLAFEGFTGTSINSVTGGADVQDLPLPILLATTVALAGLAWIALRFLLLGLEVSWLPLYPWDAWTQWATKARVWFQLGRIVPFAGSDAWFAAGGAAYFDAAPGNPPTVPLLPVWACIALGRWDDALMNVPWWQIAVALAFAAYGTLRALDTPPLAALVVT